MNSNDSKPITFIYEKDEYLINVDQSIPLERLLDQIKIDFDIQSENNLDLFDPDTNITQVNTDQRRRLCFQLIKLMNKNNEWGRLFFINFVLPLLSE